jgi:hypothetical protein
MRCGCDSRAKIQAVIDCENATTQEDQKEANEETRGDRKEKLRHKATKGGGQNPNTRQEQQSRKRKG